MLLLGGYALIRRIGRMCCAALYISSMQEEWKFAFCVGGGSSGRYVDELLDRYLYTNRNESHLLFMLSNFTTKYLLLRKVAVISCTKDC